MGLPGAEGVVKRGHDDGFESFGQRYQMLECVMLSKATERKVINYYLYWTCPST